MITSKREKGKEKRKKKRKKKANNGGVWLHQV